MPDGPSSAQPPRLPRVRAQLIRALLPLAERNEVMADLEAEYLERERTCGRRTARRWLTFQAVRSLPPLLRRGFWRGMTGFEPNANRMTPGGPMFESWIMDMRYAARRLRKRPMYAALAIFTLALGAGGTAAVFSVVRTILLNPLPIADEARVGVFWFPFSWSESEFLFLRPQFPGFQQVAAYRTDNATLEVDGAPLRLVEGVAASSELFDVLGVRPFVGRTFRDADDRPGADAVSVLSYRLWQELGADPNVVGKTLQLGGIRRTIVGVMPRTFWFPTPTTMVWNATALNPANGSGRYALIARAEPGASANQLEGRARAIAVRLATRYKYPAQWDKTTAPAIVPAREYLVGSVSPSLNATLAAMLVILLIACANVSALMLGQMDSRAAEFAVRTALGADRHRLMQQLVFESLLIGLGAGLVGAAIAAAGFSMLVRALPLGDLAEATHLDWSFFWTSIGAALAASMLVAFVAAIALRGRSLRATMAAKRIGGIEGRGGRIEAALVVGQMAMTVVLAVGAGLLIHSVVNLRSIDPGFDVRRIVIADAVMPSGLPLDERRRTILQMLPALRALPGVQWVAASEKLPLRGSGDNFGIGIKGRQQAGSTTAFREVTRDYFRTLGMRITRGRNFGPEDRQGTEAVTIINEALAAKYFPNEDPIGQVIQTINQSGERVVGVVSNAAEAKLTDPPVPARYVLYDQMPPIFERVSFVLKADSAEHLSTLVDLTRSTIRADGRQLALQKVLTTASLFELALGATGQVVTLLSLLAGLALALGAVGVYGVVSHYVTRRSRDYGICIALGETPGRVVRQVVGRGLALVAAGSLIGLLTAAPLTKLLSALLYGLAPVDPLAIGGTIVILLIVGGLATFVPARRASLTDPSVVLRQS